LARSISLILHSFRLAGNILSFRKDYSPPSCLPSRPYSNRFKPVVREYCKLRGFRIRTTGEKQKKSCCTRADATCGTIHTYTGYDQMACSEDVYQKPKGSKSLRSSTPHHMEATMVYFAPRRKYGKVVSTGHQCMWILETSS
jgi:hypothetical protein